MNKDEDEGRYDLRTRVNKKEGLDSLENKSPQRMKTDEKKKRNQAVNQKRQELNQNSVSKCIQ
jgi:hypothetical protein